MRASKPIRHRNPKARKDYYCQYATDPAHSFSTPQVRTRGYLLHSSGHHRCSLDSTINVHVAFYTFRGLNGKRNALAAVRCGTSPSWRRRTARLGMDDGGIDQVPRIIRSSPVLHSRLPFPEAAHNDISSLASTSFASILLASMGWGGYHVVADDASDWPAYLPLALRSFVGRK